MRNNFEPKVLLIHFCVSLSISAIATYFGKFNFWIAFVFIEIALIVNGRIADWEDRQPGGFENPEGIRRESWKSKPISLFLIFLTSAFAVFMSQASSPDLQKLLKGVIGIAILNFVLVVRYFNNFKDRSRWISIAASLLVLSAIFELTYRAYFSIH
jgi:hypothetical protein